MRWPLFLLVPAALIGACSETPPLAPNNGSELAKGGGGRPGSGNVTAVTLGFTNAKDIDEYGRIVGSLQSRSGIAAILWTPATRRASTGSTLTLPGIGGTQNFAEGLNEAEQVAGIVTDASGAMHAVLWNAGALQRMTESGVSQSVADELSDPFPSGA